MIWIKRDRIRWCQNPEVIYHLMSKADSRQQKSGRAFCWSIADCLQAGTNNILSMLPLVLVSWIILESICLGLPFPHQHGW